MDLGNSNRCPDGKGEIVFKTPIHRCQASPCPVCCQRGGGWPESSKNVIDAPALPRGFSPQVRETAKQAIQWNAITRNWFKIVCAGGLAVGLVFLFRLGFINFFTNLENSSNSSQPASQQAETSPYSISTTPGTIPASSSGHPMTAEEFQQKWDNMTDDQKSRAANYMHENSPNGVSAKEFYDFHQGIQDGELPDKLPQIK